MFDRLGRVEQELRAAAGIDPRQSTDAEVTGGVVTIERLRALLDGLSTRLVAELESRDLHGLDGASSTPAWMAHQGRMSGAAARRRVRTARVSRHLPVLEAAMVEGSLPFESAALLAAARTPATEEALARDEAMLVGHAQTLPVDSFARLMRRWRELADADGTHDDAADRATRFLRMAATLDGTWVLQGKLDAASGAMVHDALEAIGDELWRARSRDAEVDPTLGEAVPPAQRRADALIEMARRASTAHDGGAPPRPSITIVVRAEDVENHRGGTTDFGSVLHGASTCRLLCNASIAAVVTGAGGEILDAGRSIRVPSAAQRRALVVRDRGCVFPGCDRPPGWCDAHHLVPWSDGGATDLTNLVLLCSHHHHLVHERGWKITRGPDRRLEFRRPDGTKLEPPEEWRAPTG
ncbi:MAG: DUF222 domain-containing protein [Acidimicrobiia bacterium]